MARPGDGAHRAHPAERIRPPHQGRRHLHVLRRLRRHDRLLPGRRDRRGHGRRVGAHEPHPHRHEQLVPLREGLRRHRGLHRLHDDQVLLDPSGPRPLVQGVPVRHRGHQYPHRRGERLRERHQGLGHHLGLHRGRGALRRHAQRAQRHCRPHQHRLHDRLVRHLHLQEARGHAVAGHDLGLHPCL